MRGESDLRVSDGISHLANVADLNGLRIELAKLGADSLQRKVTEGWK